MTDRIQTTLQRLCRQLRGRLSLPGDERHIAATAIWAKPAGGMPRAVAHCWTPEDVQSAIRAALSCDLPLSVRGGGHDWAGRALCDGLVIDIRGMNHATTYPENGTAKIGGGALASEVLDAIDPFGLAAVTGSCSGVGMAGLTLGGGYGPLIGRFGLALDNLLTAKVVLADGRIVTANHHCEDELFWALRGGGGNFGVVTEMHQRLHPLPSVCSGMLVYPFSEAKAVLTRSVEIAASVPEDLTVQLGLAIRPDGSPVVLVVPTWSGAPQEGEAQCAPFVKLGTLLAGALGVNSYRASLKVFDPFIVNGQRQLMETCWLPALDSEGIDALIAAMEIAVSPGCAIFTHEFKGAASRIPCDATAFGLRRHDVLIEILATFADRSDKLEEQRHHRWAWGTTQSLAPMALPGGYPNLLARGDAERVAKSYGCNVDRLVKAKRRYDPDHIFYSAIPLPIGEDNGRLSTELEACATADAHPSTRH
jgi:FAD/FMN-containing dehydrogenase